MTGMDRLKTMLASGLITLSAVAGLSLVTSPFTFHYLSKREDSDVREYVEEHLEEIINAQEQELGIEYTERPVLRYRLPDDEINLLDTFAGKASLGIYNPDEEVIYLRSGVLATPGFNISDFFAQCFTIGRVTDTLPIISHELVHFYTDKRWEELTGMDWGSARDEIKKNPSLIKGFGVVVEGIATYVQKRVHPNEDFQNVPAYEAARDFVAPLIDRFGGRGIDYLLLHIPTEQELNSPRGYYKKAGIMLDYCF